jgi:hypothetical protein
MCEKHKGNEMTFKIHTKLNRIVETSISLKRLSVQIQNALTKKEEDHKALDLLLIHYMQTEMEYGKLIGEEINHTNQIEFLLEKHKIKKGDLDNGTHA